ncbi:PEBP-like protein [Macrolepiota fuliginosa MF-IS2]|uniref:PEBP-like protein n=1 Tax=Macrolepiota fuliginosa MF-IS2 TaxID=1400762 RepID=A0A9P6C9A3_9AGAR|nr:PEBP-like protein [Macrolepiota fuliginosa MF-IS2]
MGTNSSLSNVTMAFTQARVVPNVIPSFNPVVGADPMFTDPATSEAIEVVPGILLTMEQTQNAPQFSLSSNNTDLSMSNVSWVIAIVDPDAPTPQNPNISQFLHFIDGTGDDMANLTALTNTSQALVEFFSPTPPPGSDPHRYVVLVYVQPDDFNTTGPAFFNGTASTDPSFNRMNFSITDFATNTSLGAPVAGNFFLVGPGNTTTTPSSSIIPSNTLPLPSSVSTPVVFTTQTLPLATSPAASPLAASPPATTDGSAASASGAGKVVSNVQLIVLGALSAVLGLFL